MSKLTDKQEAFCQEYVVDMNGTKSAIRAGYSEKTANRIASNLLSKVDIQQRIAEFKQERCQRVQIDADWVLMAAKKIYDRCMQEEPILDRDGKPVTVFDGSGEIVAAYKFDSSGANKALDTIGKHVNVNAFGTIKAEPEDQEATSLTINFGVNSPVDEVKVTRGDE